MNSRSNRKKEDRHKLKMVLTFARWSAKQQIWYGECSSNLMISVWPETNKLDNQQVTPIDSNDNVALFTYLIAPSLLISVDLVSLGMDREMVESVWPTLHLLTSLDFEFQISNLGISILCSVSETLRASCSHDHLWTPGIVPVAIN